MSALDRVMGNPAAFPQAVQDATYNPDNYAFSRLISGYTDELSRKTLMREICAVFPI